MNEDSFGKECPKCGTKWKVTHFGAKVWKDCLKCEDTAENLVSKTSKSTTECPVTARYDGADWLVADPHGPWPQSYSLPVNKDADEDDVDWGDIPFMKESRKSSFSVAMEEVINKAMKDIYNL